jgi:hypothetical protein
MHAVAFVYCHVVVTERRLANLAKQLRIEDRYGTIVTSEVADIPKILALLAKRSD